jgi:hypothetical protein
MGKNTYTLTIRYRRNRTEVRTYATHAAAVEGFQTVAGNALTLDMILTHTATGMVLARYAY